MRLSQKDKNPKLVKKCVLYAKSSLPAIVKHTVNCIVVVSSLILYNRTSEVGLHSASIFNEVVLLVQSGDRKPSFSSST